MNNCKKLFKVGKNLSKGVFSLILFTCGFVSAASVAPLYFENVGSSAMDNPETQQQYWESLMKYKLWGTNGIDVAEKVIIGDNVGYNGTASGDFVIRNFQHHFGGPTMVGGDFIFSSTTDTISMGPVRVLGDLQVNGKSNNVMEGDWCVQGNITQRYNDGSLNYWNEILTGGIYNDATTLSKKKGSYEDCNEVIAPPVETEMTVPIWPEPDSWEGLEAISMTSSYPNETYLIHVPPDSVETNEYGTYDKYITNFSIGGSTGKVLYVLMPPGGKLTRIYSQNGFNFSNSANDMKIIVAYVDDGVTFDRTTMKWDVAAPASKAPPYENQPANGSSWEFTDIDKINLLSNTDYAGNLLFYTTQNINWSYWKSASFQGSWISTGTITVGGHFKLAGQVIANNLKFQADVSGDFRYVPFDPPILNIDPTALASGKFLESDANQYVPIKLDAIPTTMVEFNYCFEAPDSTGEGIASFADFDKEKANMAICGIDTGHVVIPVGKLYPTDSLFVNAVLDGVVEDEESFKLHVFDMGGAVLPGNKRSGSFTLYIKDVDKNFPPVFNDTIFSVPENSKVNAVVGTLKAADINKDDLTYTVLGGDSTIFRVDASGKVILKQEVLDFETRTDYELTVFVTDDLLNDTAIVKITVLDVNEKPVVKDSSFSIAENTLKGTSVGTLTFSDPDKLSPNNTLNFSILSGNGDGFFSISSTGELSVAKDDLDFETTESYTLKVLLSDAGSPVLSDTATIKITVLDVNEKPVVKDSSFSIAENTLKGTSVGTLTFSDPDKLSPNNTLNFSILSGNGDAFFSISSTGELSVAKDGLDFETTASYTLTVLLTDAGSPSLKDTATVQITILDVNEKPIISDASYLVEENNKSGLLLGTLSVSEPDILAPNNTLSFEILSGNDGAYFAVSDDGKLTVARSGLDFESVESYTLTILVSDAGTPVLSDTATVQITVLDVNEKPTVKDDAFSIAEKTLKGTSIGTLTFSDPDKLSPNNTLSFSILSGNGEGFFSVSSTGKISVAKDGLDFEKVSSYTLTIQVSDAGSPSLKDTATVKITVLDVNEKPVVEDDAFSIAENSNKGTSVGTLTFSDPDKLSPNNTLSFSILSGNGDGFFSVSSAGKISVAKTGLDFEKVSNYTLTIRIADAGSPSLSDTATIEISILNVNEKPVIADAEFTIPRSATAADLVGVLKATDVDAGDQALLSYAVITSGVPFEQKSSSADLIVKGTTPFVNVAKNIYLFEVVVTDKGGLKDTASVTVKVKNNAPEIVTEEIQIAENSRDSIKVEVSDADGDTKFSYSITDPNNKFVINPSTGVVSLKKDVSLNYESADSVLFIQVTVSDGLESTTKKIKVKVVDVNERPNIENQSFVVAENALVNTEFGQVKASDPDNDKLTYSVIGGDSDFFTLNEKSGMLSVKKAELDYEKKKSYSLKVVVNDGKLKDTAVVTINISNILEQSIVNVMTVESGITRYEIKKDTAFINRTFANISWVLINKLGKNSYKDTSLQDLPDGCHTYRFADTDKTIDIRGRDSVTICVSTSVPEVVIKPLDKDSSKITGVTIVEGTSSKDSSFYVNEKDNDLVAIVKDPLTNSVDTLPLQVRLDSVVVPKKVLETATEIQKEFFPEPNDSTKKVTIENGKVAVEYTQKVNGTTVTVKYYETESGEKILDSEGREVVYVTYATVLNGDTVKISYPADALTGKPVKVVAGANSSNGSNVSGGSGESGSSSSSKPGTSSKPGSNNNSGSSSNGSGSNSSSGNGSGSSSGSSEDSSILDSFVGGVFEISYVYQDKKGNIVEVSYPVDKKGNILENENGDKSYEVTYSYVNSYGNSASHTVSIILDEVLPVVKILSPEHLSKHSSVSIEVVWTVDGVEQDTLTLQSLDVGTNIIIRTFRDKAGNEASDTVAITMKNAKNVVISMVEPVVKVDPEKAEELYAGNPPEEDERFAVSIFNPREEKEELVLSGNSSKVEKERGEEPYPGHSGAHLGPTMKVELKMPSVNAFGGLATIDDMIESDGLVSLEAGGGWDREKITVDEYISDYCSEEFQKEVDKSNLAATPLYTVKYKMHVWIYTSLGNFVDDFSFSLDLTDGNLVNDAGVLELFFEMKPGVDGALRASSGRLLGTGAYLVKTEISSVAKLRCQLPDKKVGSKIIEKENDLTSFGYSRPVHLK